MGSCFSVQFKLESSCHDGGELNNIVLININLDHKFIKLLIFLMCLTVKVTSATIPPSPRSQDEILKSGNLKSFSFQVLKTATRNFRPDSVLGEGGFGLVFKGWIDEQSLTAARPGTGTVIAVKRLNQDGIQGHQEWLVSVCVSHFADQL